ncbi:AfsR/SARP family transcriptional regulator [Streptacidiphilus melanogenes]|uniref:AfsR/SARP family transcriptional regulator n=1 Tax=Streptacidiphilus melanogenes TaxID=411235 RepID=UPI0005A9B876|nr:BTAD domain-containing putative transcriptional regulator [Streptacidiphilus melanogenes]
MGPVRYRILGTTQAVRDDGTPLPVGGARLRALLTVLALRAPRGVPVAVLVDEVWGAQPPAEAHGALQALVTRLRRALGPGAIVSVDSGYRLAAVPEDVDLFRFDRLAADGARALAQGDPARAAALLDESLALWQEPALADLPDREAEARRWEVRHTDARRARFEALLALGRAEAVLPELTALCDASPLDEPFQAQRLRALRDAGRTAEALAAYEDVRRTLADRLGADPSAALRALHAQMLSPVDPTPSPAPGMAPGIAPMPGSTPAPGTASAPRFAPAQGTGSAAVPGSPLTPGAGTAPGTADGIELAPSSGAAPAPGSEGTHGPAPAPGSGYAPGPAPAPPAADVSGAGIAAGLARKPGNLRARLTSFVGRGADIEAIRADLGRVRLVTLLGPGGAGKTRLSQEAAEGLAGSEGARDGVWLAELAPVRDPRAVPEAVVSALGVRETVLHGAGAEELRAVSERHGDDPLARLVEHCADRRMLLILDNCEHVIDAAAELAQQLLARCPGLTVLATSREPLGVPGELLRPVEPLPQPFALRLFGERGSAVRPGFTPEEDPEAVAEICRRLDGLPLAIELAAARLRMLTPRQIADRLDDRFRLLTSGARTALPRQQTLRAVVDWSWDLLDESERAVLSVLSVFRGGCDLAAAEAVCGPDALDALASLVDKSLVVARPDEGDAGMRYRLLETVAEYAGDRLDERGRRAEAERAHLTYYRELARTTDPLLRGHGQRAAVARLERDYENLRTALRRAVDARDEQEAISLVLSLSWFWQMRDLRADARAWAEAASALGPDPFAGPVRPAPPLFERCTDVPPPLSGDLLDEARRQVQLHRLAYLDTETEWWQSEEGRARLRAIIDTYRADLPQACRPPGNVWYFAVLMSGNPDRLHELTDVTARTCRELGYDWELALVLQLRANLLANRSEWAQQALADADEAMGIFTRLGDEWGVAESLSARGEAHEKLGRYVEATADYTRARELAEEMGAHTQVTILQVRLGQVLIEQGEGERGERMLWETLESSRRLANEARPAARMFLVLRLGETGRTAQAREQLTLLRTDATSNDVPFVHGVLAGMEAMIDVLDRRTEAALEQVARALDLGDDPLVSVIMPHLRAQHLLTAARALTQRGDEAGALRAARLVGAADASLPDGHVRAPTERRWRTAAEAEVRALLGGERYDGAYAEGGGLSPEEATALL